MRMAETRAVDRALRKAYGIGLCSVEELGRAGREARAASKVDDHFTQISRYLRCPRSYRYRYLDGWREKDTRAAMVFGRCFEQALSAYFHRQDPTAVLFKEWGAYRDAALGYPKGREATAKHSEWGTSLNAWYKVTKNADWKNFADVRNSWKNSDVVGRFVVFDISHNRCRLIATIKYKWRMVYIRRILSHAEYDEKEWQQS
jgi:mRNA interferase HigB